MTRRGAKLGPDSLRVSPEAALRAHTLEGAISIGRESEFGSLEAGKRADFAVLGTDPVEADPATIAEIPVLATWIDGEPAFTADA